MLSEPLVGSNKRSNLRTVIALALAIVCGVVIAGGVLTAVLLTRNRVAGATLLFAWKQLNFTWKSSTEYISWVSADGPQHCLLAGVKISPDGTMFVSVPRWKTHVPATLSRVVANSLLDPYPSWDMNTVGDPNAFQSVLGFEIDPRGRLWALDQGKIDGAAAKPGSIKLVVWDTVANSLVLVHRFNASIASPETSFLNDIVVDARRGFAFITDSGLPIDSADNNTYGALIVFDLARNASRRVLHRHYSTVHDPTLWLNINGKHVNPKSPMRTGADGIALSADGKTLYWCPLTSHALYSINTELLRNFSTPESEITAAVRTVCSDRGFASDGLAVDSTGRLLATSLELSSVRAQKTGDGCAFETLAEHDRLAQWPDTLAFDHHGNIVFVSNRLYQFTSDNMNWGDTNFRIWGISAGVDSYMSNTSVEV